MVLKTEAYTATANQGSQVIGWKFSTPLQADYLNTFIAGFSTPGLLTRPKIETKVVSYGADVVIKPFSLLIVPEDVGSSVVDENRETIIQKLVKVTTTNDVKITIADTVIALGFKYSFKDPQGSTQSAWYGEIVALSENNFREDDPNYFHGIVIATVQWFKDPTEEAKKHCCIKTSGADISDFLLMAEGFNPRKWLSMISPRRAVPRDSGTVGIYYNKLEVRTHNDSYKGYINGNSGLNLQNAPYFELTYNVDERNNPNGIRGFMQFKYTAFRLQSDGFHKAESSNTLPIEKTSGGIFAIVDATNTAEHGYDNAFTNNLIIKPVESEDINIYYDNNTLFIR